MPDFEINTKNVDTIGSMFNSGWCKLPDGIKFDTSKCKRPSKSELLAAESYMLAKQSGRNFTLTDFTNSIKMFELQEELNNG